MGDLPRSDFGETAEGRKGGLHWVVDTYDQLYEERKGSLKKKIVRDNSIFQSHFEKFILREISD